MLCARIAAFATQDPNHTLSFTLGTLACVKDTTRLLFFLSAWHLEMLEERAAFLKCFAVF